MSSFIQLQPRESGTVSGILVYLTLGFRHTSSLLHKKFQALCKFGV